MSALSLDALLDLSIRIEVLLDNGSGCPGCGDGGWNFMGVGAWWLALLLVLAFFSLLAIYLLLRPGHGATGEELEPEPSDPIGILKTRYAKGEISTEEYEKKLKGLEL